MRSPHLSVRVKRRLGLIEDRHILGTRGHREEQPGHCRVSLLSIDHTGMPIIMKLQHDFTSTFLKAMIFYHTNSQRGQKSMRLIIKREHQHQCHLGRKIQRNHLRIIRRIRCTLPVICMQYNRNDCTDHTARPVRMHIMLTRSHAITTPVLDLK